MTTNKQATESIKFKALSETARNLFYHHGIKRVSVKEICLTAKVSKMTFYRFFKDKNAIAMHIVTQIVDQMQQLMDDIIQKDISFDKKMQAIMTAKAEMMNEFSHDFLSDLLNEKLEAGRFLMRRKKEMIQDVREMFVAAQKNGEIRKGIKIDFIIIMADYFRVFMMDEKFRDLYDDPISLMKEINDFYLYGIVAR